MAAVTRCPTEESIIASLRELVQINLDSFNGYRQAGNELHDDRLARKFEDLSRQRWQQADDLQRLLMAKGEEPLRRERVSSRIERTILDWRRAFGICDLALLQEAERAEEYVKAKYEAALSRLFGSVVFDFLNSQYARVQAAHDWLAGACGIRERVRASGNWRYPNHARGN